MVHTANSAITTKRRERPIALDAELRGDILSGEIANFMFVLKTTRLNTADYARNFHVTYSSISMIQNMDRKVHSQEPDS